MKRAIIIGQIAVLCLFAVKVIGAGGILQAAAAGRESRPAAAPQAAPPSRPAVPAEIQDDGLARERSLEEALRAKLRQLEQREEALKKEEQRLALLKQEIMEKMDGLRALQQQIASAMEAYKAEESKRIKNLAKVYEAMPPAKAGAMLETLDIQTAAGITMYMKREKAGTVWGYLSPKRAAEITKEITQSLKTPPEDKS